MIRQTFTTSTGHSLSGAGFLDMHFEINRPDYEQIIETLGFEPGWHVLDAGCGGGSFLPLLADRVGAEGKLTAIDLAPENVEVTTARLSEWHLPCPVDVRTASIGSLPYEDSVFDAVWCANVSQYLTDEDLEAAIAEFVRVTRPGGLVVIKESASIFTHIEPAPPCAKELLVAEVACRGSVQAAGVNRAWMLQCFLERAGLSDVAQRTHLVERRAPLSQLERQAFGTLLSLHAELAQGLPLPNEYADFWQRQLDPDGPAALVNNPSFYFTEGLAVATGLVMG